MTQILISEVGPRDGLQSTHRIMPLAAKKAWIKAEAEAGVREIEVGSFVPPSLLPQLADTAEVVAYAKTIVGLNVVALVPNAKGATRAAEAGVHGMSIPFSMSETHSIKNVRKTHAEMIDEIRHVAAIAQKQAHISQSAFRPPLAARSKVPFLTTAWWHLQKLRSPPVLRNSACQTQPAMLTQRRSSDSFAK